MFYILHAISGLNLNRLGSFFFIQRNMYVYNENNFVFEKLDDTINKVRKRVFSSITYLLNNFFNVSLQVMRNLLHRFRLV